MAAVWVLPAGQVQAAVFSKPEEGGLRQGCAGRSRAVNYALPNGGPVEPYPFTPIYSHQRHI